MDALALPTDGTQAADAADRPSRLTRREHEILQLLAQGHSNAQLAKLLWVTEQTIKFHLSNIYRKLNVANRTEAGALGTGARAAGDRTGSGRRGILAVRRERRPEGVSGPRR